MKFLRQAFSGVATLALIVTLGFSIPSFADTADAPENSASSAYNKKLALHHLDVLNASIRGLPRAAWYGYG